jgi:hypothetical protein
VLRAKECSFGPPPIHIVEARCIKRKNKTQLPREVPVTQDTLNNSHETGVVSNATAPGDESAHSHKEVDEFDPQEEESNDQDNEVNDHPNSIKDANKRRRANESPIAIRPAKRQRTEYKGKPSTASMPYDCPDTPSSEQVAPCLNHVDDMIALLVANQDLGPVPAMLLTNAIAAVRKLYPGL